MPPRAKHSPPPRARPRLYIVARLENDVASLMADLSSADSGQSSVAALLLHLPAGPKTDIVRSVRALAPLVQNGGVALLIDGDLDVALEAGADGAHLTGAAALRAALPRLKPALIAGAGGLASRHDAMLAGEAGADYVMFGEPDPAGQRPALAAVVDRVAWWSEVFEPPCVGYAGDLEELSTIARAGADFVALRDVVWNHAAGPRAALAAAAERLRALEFV